MNDLQLALRTLITTYGPQPVKVELHNQIEELKKLLNEYTPLVRLENTIEQPVLVWQTPHKEFDAKTGRPIIKKPRKKKIQAAETIEDIHHF